MKDTLESFKIDMRTEIKDELKEMQEVYKHLKTEVEGGVRHEGCGTRTDQEVSQVCDSSTWAIDGKQN